MSKNAHSIDQLKIACRHVIELMDAGVSENFAIRLLEQLSNMYAKYKALGSVTPDHVDDYVLWSRAALASKASNPSLAPGRHLRCEHGTPRREFARDVLAAYKDDKLTKEWLDQHCEAKWKVAVITHDEDLRLNKVARARAFATPEDRWRAAGIEF